MTVPAFLSRPLPPLPGLFTPQATGPRIAWQVWLERMLLALGSALVLAAIMYFFAFNWLRVPPFARFALVEGGFILCLVGVLIALDRNTPAAQFGEDTGLLATAVLSGIFWAVFGQIYQTGADAWQLFGLWTLCILPWLAVTRTLAVWTLFIIVANIGLALWVEQTKNTGNYSELPIFLEYLLMFNVAALLFCVFLAILGSRRAKRFAMVPLPLLLCISTLLVCQFLVQAAEWRGDAWLSDNRIVDMPFLVAVTSLVVLFLVAIRRRMTSLLYMLALCGFPLLNCALFIFVPDEILSILLYFTVANLVYAFLLAKFLPSISLPSAIHRLAHKKIAARIEPAQPIAETTYNQEDLEASADAFEPLRESDRRLEAAPAQPVPNLGYQITMGVAAVITAFCLAALVGWFMYTTNSGSSIWSFMGVGFAGVVAGTLTFRMNPNGPFVSVLAASLVLAGLAAITIVSFAEYDELIGTVIFTALTLGLYFLLPQAVMRFITVLISVLLILTYTLGMVAFSRFEGFFTPTSTGVLLICGLTLPWLALGKKIPGWLWPAAAAGLVALMAFYTPQTAPLFGSLDTSRYVEVLIYPHALTLLAALSLILLAWYEGRNKMVVAQALVLAVALALAWRFSSTEVLLSLTLLALGNARRIRPLTILGAVLLITFLSKYYYLLDLSLLDKSLRIGLTGLTLLAGAAFVVLWRHFVPANDLLAVEPVRGQSPAAPRFHLAVLRTRKGLAIGILGVLFLGAFQYAIFDKEQLLAAGDELLMPLMPVDPRSLMQGDYMRLRYQLETELADLPGDDLENARFAILNTTPLPNGRLVGGLETVRFDQDPTRQASAYAIGFRKKGYASYHLHLHLPPSFMFQEGHASIYENARYAVLRCNSGGHCLLTGLADENGHTITPEP